MEGWDETRSSLKVLSVNEQAERMFQVGNYYFEREMFDPAIDAYTEAIAIKPTGIVYWTNRALCHRKKKDWARLEEDCTRAVQLDSDSVKAHYMLGVALLGKGTYAEGFKELEMALSLGRRAGPKSYIVEEIWQELAKAKYSEWKQATAKRSSELQKLKETCIFALKQKRALDYLESEGFTNVNEKSSEEELEALSQVFKEVAVADLPKEIPDYLCCKITYDIFRDPVITPSGITYERKVLLDHLEKVGKFDPVARRPLQASQLAPNLAIKGAVHAFLNQHGWAYRADADEQASV